MLKKTTKELCALCKGSRKLCGASVCPILVKKSMQYIVPKITKRQLSAYSEWLLVGEYGYPKVRYGPISALSSMPWSPEEWARKRLDFSNILRLRIQTVFPYQHRHISRPPSIYDSVGEAVASTRPIGIELYFSKPPKMRLSLDADIPPIGGSGPLKRVEVDENPRIPRRYESIITDRIKASRAVEMLYKYGASIYYLSLIHI